jgi:hypothetical protein
MAKPNYHQARKQKEVARKARQQEKQQRRSARLNAPGEEPNSATTQESGDPREPGSENQT